VLRRLLGASTRRPGRRIADAEVGPVILNMAQGTLGGDTSSIGKSNRLNIGILRESRCAVHVVSDFTSVGGSSSRANTHCEIQVHGQKRLPGLRVSRADIVTPASWDPCLCVGRAQRSFRH
jgi:hypothetical protein